MTPAQLKYNVEQAGSEPHFFTRSTMKFFGDTMSNYGCCSNTVDDAPVWELWRKRPVKHGVQSSAYFNCETFERMYKGAKTL